MDWSRAKNILILILLALNIFLFVNISVHNPGSSISGETISNTVKILGTRGITVKCEVPRTNNAPGKLSYNENAKLDKLKIARRLLADMDLSASSIKGGKEAVKGSKKLTFTNDYSLVYEDTDPKENINISDKKSVEKSLRRYLDMLYLPSSAYYLDVFTKNTDGSVILKFREKYKDYFVFENCTEITATKDGVINLKCEYREMDSMMSPNKKIISAYQILLKQYGDGTKAVITDIDLGFMEYKLGQDTREIYKRPVWRVRTGDGKERFFSASEGEEIQAA